ncbi:MAG: ATP-grasp domain-containing protein [Lachnospiraceae bacterium]|nr:ATP-grasp domain-containing protein [Lachnospiraceae bacterium]
MRLWVTAGGTGSAWHIASIVKQYYADKITLYISDINDAELVASSTLADFFFKVPPVKETGYAEYMYDLLRENQIDVIIPLIPWEQRFFAPDLSVFASLGVKSIAPVSVTDNTLNHKKNLYRFCILHELPIIRQYEKEELEAERIYFCKPTEGFGAMDACTMSGKQILERCESGAFDWERMIVQEYCEEDGIVQEVTVEAFWDQKKLRTICRRRLESKSGVCTKAAVMKLPEADNVMQKIAGLLELPMVFNIQFVHHEDCWKIMDVNLRLAAGTGLSNAAGFQLIRALLANLLGLPVEEGWFQTDESIKTILRVYQEIVI